MYGELSPNQRLQAARVIASVGLDRITWTGGEPTLCKDLPDLLRVMTSSGIANTVTTHGLRIPDEVTGALRPSTDCLRISFDGLRETHNAIRKARVFDKTLGELERVCALGVRAEVNISAMRENVADIPDLARFLAARGVSKIVVIALVRRESAVDNELCALTDAELDHLTCELRKTLAPHPDVGLRVNDYSVADDTYVIVESSGRIVLSSETRPDEDLGSILSSDGAAALRESMNRHTLLHQHQIRTAALIPSLF